MIKVKFRGQKVDSKEWVYGYVYFGIPETHITYIIPEWIYNGYEYEQQKEFSLRFEKYEQVEPTTVGMFIGLKDKNGKEIYADDIVGDFGDPNCFKIVWDKKYAAFGYIIQNNNSTTISEITEDFLNDQEVIGNIHDNPELLG